MTIPKVERYKMSTGWKTHNVWEEKNPKGDWVRYEDVKWMIYLLNQKNKKNE